MTNYQDSGVSIDAGNDATRRIKRLVNQKKYPTVLNQIGGFAALLDLKPLYTDYSDPLLVQSIDGLGTKPIIARLMDDYSTLGQDLLSATANDIIVLGATPLWLLDYIGNDKLDPNRIESFIAGLVKACNQHKVALVGGETAEMPNVYQACESDIAGIITGVVNRNAVITGELIEAGDHLYGLASNGLHTNGYSLARHVLFNLGEYDVDTYVEGLNETVGEALLKPHLNYTPVVNALMSANIRIHGMSHITGGGVIDNIPRILRAGLSAEINTQAIPIPPIFSLINHYAQLGTYEAYRTFNMGIGFVIVIPKSEIDRFQTICDTLIHYDCYALGQIIESEEGVILL